VGKGKNFDFCTSEKMNKEEESKLDGSAFRKKLKDRKEPKEEGKKKKRGNERLLRPTWTSIERGRGTRHKDDVLYCVCACNHFMGE